jgi:hypothetical protein
MFGKEFHDKTESEFGEEFHDETGVKLQKFLDKNKGLIISYARKYCGKFDIDDAMSEAVLAYDDVIKYKKKEKRCCTVTTFAWLLQKRFAKKLKNENFTSFSKETHAFKDTGEDFWENNNDNGITVHVIRPQKRKKSVCSFSQALEEDAQRLATKKEKPCFTLKTEDEINNFSFSSEEDNIDDNEIDSVLCDFADEYGMPKFTVCAESFRKYLPFNFYQALEILENNNGNGCGYDNALKILNCGKSNGIQKKIYGAIKNSINQYGVKIFSASCVNGILSQVIVCGKDEASAKEYLKPYGNALELREITNSF